SEYIQSLVQKVKDAGAVGINFNYKALTSELVEIFHENGLSVSVWTVDKEIDMYKCLTCSPDNITTRNPQKLRDILP
ncbi:MAG: glycerophosphodiester phosphodiesterase family protein, partial [Ruminococcus sp.]|nr:glycerophosphodiester phosphodiesterase family protein [Ruminococcus sp.]